MIARSLAIVALVLGTGCSATRSVRPVGEGKVAVGGSLGGPVFTNLGAPIPTPLVSLYGRYGLTPKTDLDVGLHMPIISAAGLDVGAAHLLLDQAGLRPAVMAGGRAYLWANTFALTGRENPNGYETHAAPRVYEELYANASWSVGERSLVWAGLDVFGQVEEAIVRPTLVVGGEWRAARLFGLTLELKQAAFLTDQTYAAVEFLGPGGYGAFTVQLGFNFYPGAER